MRQLLVGAVLAALASNVASQSCISLTNSTECSAFNQSSISTDSSVVGLFPFLQGVTNVTGFDQALRNWVSSGYVTFKYRNLLGCNNINSSNLTNYYARYETTYICNGIIQNSLELCNLSGVASHAVCSSDCGDFANSEAMIASTDSLCSGRNSDYMAQIRADYAQCGLPANALTNSCIPAFQNEAFDCGFSSPTGTNMIGLCSLCRASSENATDSCCFTANTGKRCAGVNLPVFPSLASFTNGPTSATSTATATSSPTSGTSNGGDNRPTGLGGGAIAGIVVGSVIGALLFLGLIAFCCIAYRRRNRDSIGSSTLNQPSPQRKVGDVGGMTYNPPASSQGYDFLPGGRVARMSAMQSDGVPQAGPNARELYGDSPMSPEKMTGVLGAIKTSPGSNDSSPGSNEFSSPEGVASGQSEQLPFFKDYYSNDDIHPNDKVSVLWAYQPRAGDEFELERGDMLRVVGIWDDGWATGVRIDERAEDYDGKHKAQRDSGVSNGSGMREDSPIGGEIKAFPLVCVCLPEAWKKTVEGDSSAESGSGGNPI